MNIVHLLAAQVQTQPNAPALIDGSATRPRVTSFAELDRRAQHIAGNMLRDGLQVGDHVLFFAPPSAMLYAALVATWRIGAVAMFVEPSAGRKTLDAACILCRPAALVASPQAHLLRFVSRVLRAIPRKYSTGIGLPATVSLNDATYLNDGIATVGANAAALLTFTSGSTGTPKGAIRTHAILRAQLQALNHVVAGAAGERDLVALPIVVLLNLANGVTSVLPDADLRRPGAIDGRAVLRQLQARETQHITASPAFLERLVQSSDAAAAFSGLKRIVTGGGPVFPDLVARLQALAPQATILSVYGSTEAEPIAHVAHTAISSADGQSMAQGGGLLTGTPDPMIQLRILRVPLPGVVATSADLDQATVGNGCVGEIVVSGPHVVRHYVNAVGENETKLWVGDVVWHRTGDLGRVDELGRLWLLGRVDASIMDGARPYYPFAVECAARLTLGAVRVAALRHGHRRVLVIERGSAYDDSVSVVRNRLPWADLDDVLFVPRIPLDRRHNSKVDYPALTRLLNRRP